MLFITHLLGMPLHKGQIRYLQETYTRKTRINILVPANRWGKTTLAACIQLHYLFYKFGIPPGNQETWLKAEYRTANIAPHSANTEAVFKAIHQILTSSFAIRTTDGRQVTNKCQIEWFYLKQKTLNTPPYKQYFANNSYIEHRSLGQDGGDALQGKPFGLITYDEGGRSLHLEEEVSANLLPRLGDWMGRFDILSTPDQNSPSILYHWELFTKGMNSVDNHYSQEGSLKENELFGPLQIQEQYRMFQDDPMKDQILEGKFIFGGDALFPASDILEAKDPTLNDGIRRQDGHIYVIGTDTAMGSDEMVHSVIDVTEKPFRTVRQAAHKGNSKSPQMALNDFCDLFDSYSKDNVRPFHLLETWNGESARFYQDLPPHIQASTRCYGSWQPDKRPTENKNRPVNKNQSIRKADILLALKKLLAAKELKIPANNDKLTQQLSIYREDDSKIPTDRVISLALASYMASETAINTKVQWTDW